MHHSKLLTLARPLAIWLAAASATLAVSACAPIILGSAVVGTMAATDRRTVGTQVEDQNIELKAGSRLSGRYGDKGHINVTSHSRKVLLTGEVPTDAAKKDAESVVQGVENVTGVVNELLVGPPSSLTTRSNDVLIEGKIKASLIDAKDIFANSFKVVVERGTVYLMGRVTEREGRRGAAIAAGVSGVNKVVKVFDYITEQELEGLAKAKTDPQPASGTQSSAQ